MNRNRWVIGPILIFILLCLCACSPGYIKQDAGEEHLPETLKPTPAFTATTYPTLTPLSPSPTPVQDLKRLTLIHSGEPLLPGVLMNLFVSNAGTIWLVSDRGAARIEPGGDRVAISRSWDTVVGIDPDDDLLWAISDDGRRISSWDGRNWTHYGSSSGWLPLEWSGTRGNAIELSTSPQGVVWLGTHQGMRRFQNGHWRVYPLGAMGFSDQISKSLTSTIAFDVSPVDGALYAGTCTWRGDRPVGGQGVRVYEDGLWNRLADIPSDACVSKITADNSGRVWIGINQGIGLWEPDLGSIKIYQPPELADTTLQYGYLVEMPVNEFGEAYPLFALCRPDDCGVFMVRLALDATGWLALDDVMAMMKQEIYFDPAGNRWDFSRDHIRVLIQAQTLLEADIDITDVYQQTNGDLWVLGEYNGLDAIWQVKVTDVEPG